MIKFTAELEDMVFSATRDPEKDEWVVQLAESAQAQADFERVGEDDLVDQIILNDAELAALLFLAAKGKDESASVAEMYALLEPKLIGVPHALRPIP